MLESPVLSGMSRSAAPVVLASKPTKWANQAIPGANNLMKTAPSDSRYRRGGAAPRQDWRRQSDGEIHRKRIAVRVGRHRHRIAVRILHDDPVRRARQFWSGVIDADGAERGRAEIGHIGEPGGRGPAILEI